MSVGIVTLPKGSPVLLGRQMIGVQPMGGAKPISSGYAGLSHLVYEFTDVSREKTKPGLPTTFGQSWPYVQFGRPIRLSQRDRVGSGTERTAAAAGRLCLRILDREPGPLEAIHVIDFGALQERCTLRIHNDLDIAFLDHGVVIGHFRFERHPVLIAVTATPTDI